MPSPLENFLLRCQPIDRSREGDVDLLRQILMGELGTPNQRSSIMRILGQVRPGSDIRQRFVAVIERRSGMNFTVINNHYEDRDLSLIDFSESNAP